MRCVFSLWTFVPIFVYRQVTVLWTCYRLWSKWMNQHWSEVLIWFRRMRISPGWSRIFCVLRFCLIKDFRIKYLMLKALMIIINLLYIYIYMHKVMSLALVLYYDCRWFFYNYYNVLKIEIKFGVHPGNFVAYRQDARYSHSRSFPLIPPPFLLWFYFVFLYKEFTLYEL